MYFKWDYILLQFIRVIKLLMLFGVLSLQGNINFAFVEPSLIHLLDRAKGGLFLFKLDKTIAF